METSEPVDLNFLARQLQRLTADVASLRDDMRVLTSIVLRLDGTVTTLLQEMRDAHADPADERSHSQAGVDIALA